MHPNKMLPPLRCACYANGQTKIDIHLQIWPPVTPCHKLCMSSAL